MDNHNAKLDIVAKTTLAASGGSVTVTPSRMTKEIYFAINLAASSGLSSFDVDITMTTYQNTSVVFNLGFVASSTFTRTLPIQTDQPFTITNNNGASRTCDVSVVLAY
jgi:hypothetical protein